MTSVRKKRAHPKPSLSCIRVHGGPIRARRHADYHRARAAKSLRIVERIEKSLVLVEQASIEDLAADVIKARKRRAKRQDRVGKLLRQAWNRLEYEGEIPS